MSHLIRNAIPLSSFTTLSVGGPARFFSVCQHDEEVVECLQWAHERGIPVFVLGGGSNVLVADSGFEGLVLHLEPQQISTVSRDGNVFRVRAGVNWDAFVSFVVANNLSGVECLSGIPGAVGATPIQNVGAYGQEVADTLEHVWAVETETGRFTRFSAEECGFSYRNSNFKGPWLGRYVITAASYRLSEGAVAEVKYPELAQWLAGSGNSKPSIRSLREAVLAIRRGKSMVIDTNDPNHRSAGSFFLNPLISLDSAATVRQLVSRNGTTGRTMPEFVSNGQIKIPAAWLIEEAGFRRGFQLGRAGLSTRHTLAIVNLGGASAADLISLASLIRKTVSAKFGIKLHLEPVLLGFDKAPDDLLE